MHGPRFIYARLLPLFQHSIQERMAAPDLACLLRRAAPASMNVFIASLQDPLGPDVYRTAFTHMQAEVHSKWASPADVAALLADSEEGRSSRLAFVKALAQCLSSTLAVAGSLECGDAVVVLPCIGCNLAFHSGGCEHEGGPPLVHLAHLGRRALPPPRGQELAQAAHAAMLHIALAVSLLTTYDEAGADRLLDCLVEEAPMEEADTAAWVKAQMDRHCYWRVLVVVLTDTVRCAPAFITKPGAVTPSFAETCATCSQSSRQRQWRC